MEPQSDQNIEAIWNELSLLKSSKIFGAVYRPPNTDYKIFTRALKHQLTNLTTVIISEIVLLGDFNFDYNSTNSCTEHLKQFTNLHHLKQIITKPTRITESSKTLIDLIRTTRPEHYISEVIPVRFLRSLCGFWCP